MKSSKSTWNQIAVSASGELISSSDIKLVTPKIKEAGNKHLNFVVVGGGPTGVEMAGSIAEIAYKNMKEEFRNFKSSDANVYLIEATEKILPMYSDSLSGKAEKYLIDFGVQVRTNEKVIKIETLNLKSM